MIVEKYSIIIESLIDISLHLSGGDASPSEAKLNVSIHPYFLKEAR